MFCYTLLLWCVFSNFMVFVIYSFPVDDTESFHSSEEMARMKDMYPELFSQQYQGDILLLSEEGNNRNAIKNATFRWPNGIIPYEIHSNFTEEEKKNVTKAMNRLESETCIKFVVRNDETHYAEIYKMPRAGCFSIIGYHNDLNISHPVNLESPNCLKYQGTIEHEFLHLIGLFHEQSRSDRDDHVLIYWGNITEGMQFNFRKVEENEATSYDIPYDINSVMHYPRFAFSKNGKDTIVYKKDPTKQMGQRIGATQDDLEKVRKMYNCKKRAEAGSPEWFFEKLETVLSGQLPSFPKTELN